MLLQAGGAGKIRRIAIDRSLSLPVTSLVTISEIASRITLLVFGVNITGGPLMGKDKDFLPNLTNLFNPVIVGESFLAAKAAPISRKLR